MSRVGWHAFSILIVLEILDLDICLAFVSPDLLYLVYFCSLPEPFIRLGLRTNKSANGNRNQT